MGAILALLWLTSLEAWQKGFVALGVIMGLASVGATVFVVVGLWLVVLDVAERNVRKGKA